MSKNNSFHFFFGVERSIEFEALKRTNKDELSRQR